MNPAANFIKSSVAWEAVSGSRTRGEPAMYGSSRTNLPERSQMFYILAGWVLLSFLTAPLVGKWLAGRGG